MSQLCHRRPAAQPSKSHALKLVADEAASHANGHSATGESQHSATGESHAKGHSATGGNAVQPRQAEEREDDSHQTPRGHRMHPLTLRFDDAALEAAFRVERFRATFRGFMMTIAILVGTGTTAVLIDPSMTLTPLLFCALLSALAVLRVWLHRMPDQARAHALFSRFHYIVLLVYAVVHLAAWHGDGEARADGVPAVAVAFACCLMGAILTFHLVALDAQVKLASLVVIPVVRAIAPLYRIGRISEFALISAALALGEVAGYVLELALREGYVVGQLEKHAAVAARAAGQQQSEMAGYLFHELRNDQHAIGGVLELLEQKMGVSLPTELLSVLREARVHSTHAAQVITNMLEYTTHRAGRLNLPTDVPFQLHAVCEECCSLVRHMVRARDIALRVECPDGLPTMLGSPFHLRQVLLNLLTNAIKYTDEGSVVLRARLQPAADRPTAALNGDGHGQDAPAPAPVTIRLAVHDTGRGVPEASRQAIFEPFERGPRAGTGLGLPLSRSLVGLMGGELQLESPPSGGSVFFFEVSFGVAAEVESNGAPAELPPLPTGLRVLVADDMRLNRLILKRMLMGALPEPLITEAASGERALELLSEPNFDVAFLDEVYGSEETLKGTDVSRSVRALEAQRSSGRPVLLFGCTGNSGSAEHDEYARASGQDGCYGKPFPETFESELKERIHKWLEVKVVTH